MVHFLSVKPALEDRFARNKLKQVETENIFKNLSEEEFKKAQSWYDALRKEEQLNLNGVLTILQKIELVRNAYSEPEHFALISAGSSISSSNYGDIDLFILLRHFSNQIAKPKVSSSPFDSNDFHYTTLRAILAPFNCFYGESYDDKKPAAFVDSKFGKDISVYILQEESKYDDGHDFRKRRKEFNDDLLYVAAGAEGLIKFNKEQGSKFLVLFRRYTPLQNESISVFECSKREKCALYQHEAFKPKIKKYMCDGIGRNVAEKNIAEDKPSCPLSSRA